MMHSVSVVIPCFNGAEFLADAIKSALAQTRPPLEVIVVDDCSTDDTEAVAKSYPIRYVKTPTNRGQAEARNTGIRHARGDLIATLDADDYWEPTHLEELAGVVDRYPEVAVVFGTIRHFGERKNGEVWQPFIEPGRPVAAFEHAFVRPPGAHSATVIRRAALLEVGGYESGNYAEDFDLWLRLSRLYPFAASHRLTCHYRVHAPQLSSSRERQIDWAYRSRLALARTAEQAGDVKGASDLRDMIWRTWDQEMFDAWHDGRLDEFHSLYKVRGMLPKAPASRMIRWHLRALVPNWVLAGIRVGRGILKARTQDLGPEITEA